MEDAVVKAGERVVREAMAGAVVELMAVAAWRVDKDQNAEGCHPTHRNAPRLCWHADSNRAPDRRQYRRLR